MPVFHVSDTIVDPSASLTAGIKYAVQNQGTAPIQFTVGSAVKTADSLMLNGVQNSGAPSQLEYTYDATDTVRMWAGDGLVSTVVFHELA